MDAHGGAGAQENEARSGKQGHTARGSSTKATARLKDRPSWTSRAWSMPGCGKGMQKSQLGGCRVSQKCTPPGGEESPSDGEGSATDVTTGSGSSGGTTDLVSMVEAYAIAASSTGAAAAVSAIKAAEPVPEHKGPRPSWWRLSSNGASRSPSIK